MAVNQTALRRQRLSADRVADAAAVHHGVLLHRLKLFRASDEEQRTGIRAWLAKNTPEPGLVRSLH